MDGIYDKILKENTLYSDIGNPGRWGVECRWAILQHLPHVLRAEH